MSCWATTTRPSSDPTAIPPTDICRCRAGKCAGRTCGAALKTSPRVEARRLPPANNCWNTPSRCLPGGIESVTAPCNAPASKSTSAICGPRSICNCGVVATTRRRQDGGHLRQSHRRRAGVVDLRTQARRRAHQQRRRASPAPWGPVAPHQFRHSQPEWQPFRRTHAHRP